MSKQTNISPVIIIFGITGDLSKRKLLPALYHLFSQNILDPNTKIIGTSRRPLSVEELLKTVELCVLEKDKVCDPDGLKKIGRALSTIKLDPDNSEDYAKLSHSLDELDKAGKRQRLFYMSIPASAYEPIVKHLSSHRLNDQRTILLLEKPFGYNLESAEQSIKLVHEGFDEDQIYRIDHYLAKETAQNLLAFRMHNPIFVPLWDAQHIQSVHVKQFETLNIEGRANFYEQTGALRDVVQSHLMQLLAITLMTVPSSMGSQDIHAAKQAFFDSLDPADPKRAARAQYDSYREEVDNPNSSVETYVKLCLSSNAEQWQGTEIVLEHGKAMAETTAKVIVEFKTPYERRHNSLIFQIQPNEGISLDLVVKEPGLDNRMEHAALDFRYHDRFKDHTYYDAYERVLVDAIHGDQSLFASDDEVLSTWRVLQPILDAWTKTSSDLKTYTAGSKTV